MSFFEKRINSLTLKQVADLTSGTIEEVNHNVEITNVKSLMNASIGDVTFYHKTKYEKHLAVTKATACIVLESDKAKLPNSVIPIIVKEPYLAFILLLREFYGVTEFDSYPRCIAPSAIISPSAVIGKNVSIQENVVISAGTIIEDNVTIMPNTFIGTKVKIGKDTTISDNCSITFAHIGSNCIIRSGVRIGTSGFGFVPNLKTGEHLQIPQIAGVIIGNNVDIGANTTIDRGAIENTVIEDYVKIDNLVQIAHGVTIGAFSFLVSQSGIAGSAKIGKGCLIGAQAGVADSIEIANFTRCIGRSAVVKNVTTSGLELAGAPAISKKEFFKMHFKLKQLISTND